MSHPASPSDDALMEQVLASRAFARLGRDTLRQVVARIEMLPVDAGEVILRQGEIGDSFYIIRSGRCRVVGYKSVLDDTMEIAVLGPGDSFGEEALIRGTPRNATVEMLSEGVVARLNKDDFVRLVQNELLRSVDPEQARSMMAAGAELIDVRSASDHTNYSIRGSRNIPLDFLRKARRAFLPDKVYVTCSDQEIESAVAAFVLAQQGLDASYLRGTVGEYLQATGEFGDSGGVSVGEHGEGIIDLPPEYGAEPAGIDLDDLEFVPPTRPVLTPTATPPSPGAPVDGAEVEALRREFRLALEAQQVRHARDLEALRAEMTALIEGNSKFVIEKLLDKLAVVEQRIGGQPD